MCASSAQTDIKARTSRLEVFGPRTVTESTSSSRESGVRHSDTRHSRVTDASFFDITRGSEMYVDEAGTVSEKASLTSATMNLTNTIFGTGILAVPLAVTKAGLVLGIVFIFIGVAISAFSLYLLGVSALRRGDNQSLTTLSDAICPGLSIFVEAAVAINCILAALSYVIVASTSFEMVFGGTRIGRN